HQIPDRFDGAGVAADQVGRQMILDDQAGQIGMGVGGAPAGQAGFSAYFDQRGDAAGDPAAGVEVAVAAGVFEAEVVGADGLDFHGLSMMHDFGSPRKRGRGTAFN